MSFCMSETTFLRVFAKEEALEGVKKSKSALCQTAANSHDWVLPPRCQSLRVGCPGKEQNNKCGQRARLWVYKTEGHSDVVRNMDSCVLVH